MGSEGSILIEVGDFFQANKPDLGGAIGWELLAFVSVIRGLIPADIGGFFRVKEETSRAPSAGVLFLNLAADTSTLNNLTAVHQVNQTLGAPSFDGKETKSSCRVDEKHHRFQQMTSELEDFQHFGAVMGQTVHFKEWLRTVLLTEKNCSFQWISGSFEILNLRLETSVTIWSQN